MTNTTPQHKDTTLDDLIDYLWCDSWVHKSTRSWYAEERIEMEQEYKEKAKQALLQWRDKAVVEARTDELEWLLQEHDAENSFGYFIQDRLKQLKETPNED